MPPGPPEPGTVGEAERYRTLLEVNNALISNLTRDDLFRALAQALRRVVPFERTAIFLHDPDKDVLKLFILESELRSSYFAVGLEMAPGESHVGVAFQRRQPLLRHDLGRERQYPAEDLAYDDGVRSYVIVPLMARGACVGVLAVASTTPGQYSDTDVGFLQEVAGQVALAVENMKSYEAVTALHAQVMIAATRARALLEVNNAIISNLTKESLFRTVCQALERLISFDRVALVLHEPKDDVLRLVAYEGSFPSAFFTVGFALERRDSHFGWAFDHQRPLLRGDLEVEAQFSVERRAAEEGIRSICTVPLIVRGRSIGGVSVASRTRNQYSAANAEFLQEVANQVALAVENMTAYEEITALKARLEHENVYLQEEIRREHNFVEMVGRSPALLTALRQVEQVALTDSTVLISGETGTGKELIARAIHGRSSRKSRPLVKVNCAAISAGLVESELFGHVKGAFTGAIDRRVGRFELADRGTIFLDEVGELPLDTQVKLLRVLQEQEFEPVGSNRTVRVDVRVIAATNRDLAEAMRAGRFRADLFYRLNVFPLTVPPLRERPSDVPQLVMFFLAQFGTKFGKRIDTVSEETMDRLVRYPWPGNVRELQNVIERAVVLSQGPLFDLDSDLLPMSGVGAGASVGARPTAPRRAAPKPGESPSGHATLGEMERGHILAVLEETGWLIEGAKGAARILALHPNTLRSRMEKLGLKRQRHDIS
jgi:formate hydrogenlyase transcriptional activator